MGRTIPDASDWEPAEIQDVAGHLEDASLEQVGALMQYRAWEYTSGVNPSHQLADLPIYGDPDLVQRTGWPVWTWDETHALVGAGDDLKIIPLSELPRTVLSKEVPER